jgi:hypothetical protein
MGRVGHGLPEISPGPNLLYTSTPCRRATPETALRPQGGRPVAILSFGHPTPYAYEATHLQDERFLTVEVGNKAGDDGNDTAAEQAYFMGYPWTL